MRKKRVAPRSKTNSARSAGENHATELFKAGAVVVATLSNPREKFWGVILALSAAGLTTRAIELASFEDSANMVRGGESFVPSALFFPMHRVERIEIDQTQGSIISLAQRFESRTGLPAEDLFASPTVPGRRARS